MPPNYAFLLFFASLLTLFDYWLVAFYPNELYLKLSLAVITLFSLGFSLYLFIALKLYRQRAQFLPLFSIGMFFLIQLNDVMVHLHIVAWQKLFYHYGIIFLVFGIGYLMIKHYLGIYSQMYQMKNSLQKKENELLSAQKERLLAEFEPLKNQVNPHFLFNTFNTLISVIEDDKESAVEFVQQLSKVYRYVLHTQGKNLVCLEEELTFLNSFTYLLKQRYGENLQILINIPDGLKESYIPPLTLQLLLENAVKHNIITSKRALLIDIYSDDDKFIIIRNVLQKKTSSSESTGIGLENIKERYKHASGKEIVIEETINYFTVKLPILEKK